MGLNALDDRRQLTERRTESRTASYGMIMPLVQVMKIWSAVRSSEFIRCL